MAKFDGYCEKICDGIDVTPLSRWLALIPFEEWPQHPKMFGHKLPSVIEDTGWHGFGILAAAFLGGINKPELAGKPWCHPMLSAVMPCHFISPHTDKQPENWICRVHFPITTNEHCILIMNKSYHLEVGSAYRINTEREHSIINNGTTPRIHFLVDILDGEVS